MWPGDHDVRLSDQVWNGHSDQVAGSRTKTEENMKERDFSMLLLQTFRKDKVKAIVERLVDVLAAEMIKISQMTTL